MKVPIKTPCALCGTLKSVVEADGVTLSCPHCDRVSCTQSTCDLEPCITFDRERRNRDGR